MKKAMIKLLAVGVAVAGAFATPAIGGTPDKAARKNYIFFTSETKELEKTGVDATAGEKFGLQIGVEASSKKLKFTATKLPKGLSIDKKTGYISGKLKKPGNYASRVTVKDDKGRYQILKFKFRVAVAEWARGNYAGRYYKTPSSKTPLQISFKVYSNGKVKGKAVNGKGKSFPFNTKITYASTEKLRFSPTITFGSKNRKVGKVEISEFIEADAVTYIEASDPHSLIVAQKQPGLVKSGGKLEKFIGYKTGKIKSRGYLYEFGILKNDKVRAVFKVDGKTYKVDAPLLIRSVKAGEMNEEQNSYVVKYELYAFFIHSALRDGVCAVEFFLSVGDWGEIENIGFNLRDL